MSYKDFDLELAELLGAAQRAITRTLLNNSCCHIPYSWRTKSVNRHLDQGAQHLLIAKATKNNHHSEDNKNHLELALTKLVMAVTKAENER